MRSRELLNSSRRCTVKDMAIATTTASEYFEILLLNCEKQFLPSCPKNRR